MDLPIDPQAFGILRTGGCTCTPVLHIDMETDGRVVSADIAHVRGCALGDALEHWRRAAKANQN